MRRDIGRRAARGLAGGRRTLWRDRGGLHGLQRAARGPGGRQVRAVEEEKGEARWDVAGKRKSATTTVQSGRRTRWNGSRSRWNGSPIPCGLAGVVVRSRPSIAERCRARRRDERLRARLGAPAGVLRPDEGIGAAGPVSAPRGPGGGGRPRTPRGLRLG